MYQAVYKCRLCGAKFQVGKLYTEKRALKKSVNFSVIIPFIPNERGCTVHCCQDGSFGLADFQGFKKAEE